MLANHTGAGTDLDSILLDLILAAATNSSRPFEHELGDSTNGLVVGAEQRRRFGRGRCRRLRLFDGNRPISTGHGTASLSRRKAGKAGFGYSLVVG